MKKHLVNTITIISLSLLACSFSAYAQFDEGISNYNQGDYKKAVKNFQNAIKEGDTNPKTWNFLGLALEKTGNLMDAQAALEKAVSLEPANSSFYSNLAFVFLRQKEYSDAKRNADKAIELDKTNANAFYFRSLTSYGSKDFSDALEDAQQAIVLNNKFAAAYTLEADILMTQFSETWPRESSEKTLAILADSITSLEQCLAVCGLDPGITGKLEDHRAIYEYFEKRVNDDEKNPAAPESSDGIDLKITSKSAPGYPEAARRTSVGGTVRLVVTFRANGTIGPIVVLQGLPEGLTESAIKAAQSLKFRPQIRNSKPVTVVKTIFYSFSIY